MDSDLHLNPTLVSRLSEGNTKFSITPKSFVSILRHAESTGAPVKYGVSELALVGSLAKDPEREAVSPFASFKATLVLDTYDDEWTVVRLLNGSRVSVKDMAIKGAQGYLGSFYGEKSSLYFVTKTKGRHELELWFDVGMTDEKSRNHFSFRIPRATQTTLKIVFGTGLPQYGVIVPNSTVESEDEGAMLWNLSTRGEIDVRLLPKKERTAGGGARAEKMATTVECTQMTMHTISEGFVLTDAVFVFRLFGSKPMSNFGFRIEGTDDTKLFRVLCRNLKQKKMNGSSQVSILLTKNIVEGQEFRVHLMLETEYGDEETVRVPRVFSLDADNETGFLSVAAKSTIEIKEKSKEGLQRVDLTEIPSQIHSIHRANDPSNLTNMLFAYKFLEPKVVDLSFDINRYKDIPVLNAVIETARCTMTFSREWVLIRYDLSVRNTNRQFLRVKTDGNITIWSATISGNAIKPVADKSGTYMIPLNRPNAPGEQCKVELICMKGQKRPMKGRGTIEEKVLGFDLPINKLVVDVWLPREFKYGEFAGTLREVEVVREARRDPYIAKVSLKKKKKATVPVSMNSFLPPPSPMPAAKESSMVDGVIPVRINVLEDGRHFRFQRLLVDQATERKEISFKVRYKEIKKGFFQKRRVYKFNPTLAVVVPLLVAVIGIVSAYTVQTGGF